MGWVDEMEIWEFKDRTWGQVAAFGRRSDVHEIQTEIDAIDSSACDGQQVANKNRGLFITDSLASS